jgi:hypothetical protein
VKVWKFLVKKIHFINKRVLIFIEKFVFVGI